MDLTAQVTPESGTAHALAVGASARSFAAVRAIEAAQALAEWAVAESQCLKTLVPCAATPRRVMPGGTDETFGNLLITRVRGCLPWALDAADRFHDQRYEWHFDAISKISLRTSARYVHSVRQRFPEGPK